MDKEERYLILVWLLLIGVSLLSWEAGTSNFGATTLWLIPAILCLSFIKVRFVILDFMEIRHAPFKLRAILETWVVLTCAILTAAILPVTRLVN